jgi:hypothetical protein
MKSDEEITQLTGTFAGKDHPWPGDFWMGYVEK